jgi:hypothetical protein
MQNSSRTGTLVNTTREFVLFINSRLVGPFPKNARMRLLAAFLSTAIEHADSILLLLEIGRNTGSAFALVRALVESSYRGQWLYFLADEEAIKQIKNSQSKIDYPLFAEMAKQLEEFHKTSRLFTMDKLEWNTLCGFTHTGFEQIARRFDKQGNIRPTYTEDEIADMIRLVIRQLLHLSITFCAMKEQRQEAAEIGIECNRVVKELF